MSRNGNNGTKQEEEEGRHYGTHFESCQWASIERDCQAAHEEEIKAAKTRPAALMKDGMLYRIINVICCTAGRPLFLNTKRVMSRATLDSLDKNMSLYEGMADLYKGMTDFNMIDVIDESQMIGFGVEDDAAIDFDQLNPLEFKECLDFILAHYQEACNNKNKSGNHQPFADYTKREAISPISTSMVYRNRR